MTQIQHSQRETNTRETCPGLEHRYVTKIQRSQRQTQEGDRCKRENLSISMRMDLKVLNSVAFVMTTSTNDSECVSVCVCETDVRETHSPALSIGTCARLIRPLSLCARLFMTGACIEQMSCGPVNTNRTGTPDAIHAVNNHATVTRSFTGSLPDSLTQLLIVHWLSLTHLLTSSTGSQVQRHTD